MNDVHHLIAIAQRLAEGRIRRSSYTTAERLPAVCKTEPEPPEPEVIIEQIAELLGRLEARQPGSAAHIVNEVLPFSLKLFVSSRHPIVVIHCWLENHYWLDLDDADLGLLVRLIYYASLPQWREARDRVRKTPAAADQ